MTVLLFLLPLATLASPAAAQMSDPSPVRIPGVSIDQKLSAQIPLDLSFYDEAGKTVKLGDYFGKRPVLLTLVYFSCPMLCKEELNGLLGALKQIDKSAGSDFTILTISFDDRENYLLAAKKKENYVHAYARAGAADGWHFLTGEATSVSRLTEAVGFNYRFDTASGEFAHPTAVIVLTPAGRVNAYLFGLEYAPRDLRWAISDASDGKVWLPAEERLLKICYHFDPVTGKYAIAVMTIVKAAGVLTILAVGGLIFFLSRRRRRMLAAASQEAQA